MKTPRITAFCNTLAAAVGLFKLARCISEVEHRSPLAGFCIPNESAGALTAGNLRMKRSGGCKSRVACNFSPPSRPRACVLPLQPFAGALETGASQRGRVALSQLASSANSGGIRRRPFVGCHSRGIAHDVSIWSDALRRARETHRARVHAAGGAVPISAVPNRARSERKQISDHDAHERDAGDITPHRL